MPSVKVYKVNGDVVGTAELSDAHFGVKTSASFVHRIVIAENANRRHSIASTKTKGLVSGGGKKPWRQKGTGRARQGSTRNPQWKGGGVAFGPLAERDYSVKINRKEKRKALMMVLSDRVKHEKLLLVDKFPIESPKTKMVAEWLKKLPSGRKTLFVVPESNQTLRRMVRNLQNVRLLTANTLNAADVVRYPVIIFEQPAVQAFESLYKI